jgi:hypothetical protein
VVFGGGGVHFPHRLPIPFIVSPAFPLGPPVLIRRHDGDAGVQRALNLDVFIGADAVFAVVTKVELATTGLSISLGYRDI